MTAALREFEIVLADTFGAHYLAADPRIEDALDLVRTRLYEAERLRDAVLHDHMVAERDHTTSPRYCTDSCKIADAML